LTTSKRTIIKHDIGAIVAHLGQHYPKGIVQSQRPGNQVAVKWPDGTWSKHHARELRRIV